MPNTKISPVKKNENLGVDRQKLGLDERCAAEIRGRLLALTPVWDDPALDIYNTMLLENANTKTR